MKKFTAILTIFLGFFAISLGLIILLFISAKKFFKLLIPVINFSVMRYLILIIKILVLTITSPTVCLSSFVYLIQLIFWLLMKIISRDARRNVATTTKNFFVRWSIKFDSCFMFQIFKVVIMKFFSSLVWLKCRWASVLTKKKQNNLIFSIVTVVLQLSVFFRHSSHQRISMKTKAEYK